MAKDKLTNSREILLSQLGQFTVNDRRIVLRGLFETTDRISQLEFRISATYDEKVNGKGFEMHFDLWVLDTIDVLIHLREDILLLDKIQDWDEGILDDAFGLLTFQMTFLGDLKELKDGCKGQNSKEYVLPIGKIETFNSLADALTAAQNQVSLDILVVKRLLDKRRSRKYSPAGEPVNNEGTITTSTLRELIIQNQVLNLKYSHEWTTYKKKDERMKKIKETISFLKQLNEGDEGVQKVSSEKTMLAWRPRMIVVVYDIKTDQFLTGASQPACDHFVFWVDVTERITRNRLGENFARIIDQLSKSFHEEANGLKEDRMAEIDGLYEFAQNVKPDESEPSIRSQSSKVKEKFDNIISIHGEAVKREKSEGSKSALDLMGDPNILCLAIDGFSLSLREPCLRCQWMYSGWIHGEMPKTAREKIISVRNGLNSHIVTKKLKDESGSLSFCAESVAAAKLHLLRAGKLALVY